MNKTKRMLFIAMIAAIYTATTLVLAPISYGGIQVRIAEALVLLPLLFDDSVWGVGLGCLLANLIGAMMGINVLGYLDVIIGTFATLCAAYLTFKFRNIRIKNIPVLSILMPIIFNAVIIGLELALVLMPTTLLQGFMIFSLQVGIGELISVVVIGLPLIKLLQTQNLKKRFSL